LEAELVNNNHGGVGGVDFMEIQSLIKQSRSITTPSTSTLSTLESKLNSNRTLLESYIYRTTLNPFSLIDTNVEAHLEAYRLVFNYLSNKFKENQVANISQQPLTNYPKYFIDMEIGGVVVGRVVIATRPDIAPKMCENFKWLMTAQGQSYKGCSVFQCWKRESVITGDFEYNNGRGGYSIFNKNLFLPEDTKLISSRGAIGMRRTQKRHDSKGLVGSQFRIILQDMPGFTGIFGHVVSGLSIIDKISEYGDSSGNPTVKISIFDCGVY
jgi:cyclophilin family peptidyl-prolyl cis-trans isomerase